MSQIVQARCPHCKQTLRIPSSWLQQAMRCKHCKKVFQAKNKPAAKEKTAAAPVRTGAPAKASSAPKAPLPIQSGPVQQGIPQAVPSSSNAFDFDDSAGSTVKVSGRYKRRGNRWIGLVVGLTFIAATAGVLVAFGPQLLEMIGNNAAKAEKGPVQQAAAETKTESNRLEKNEGELQTKNPFGKNAAKTSGKKDSGNKNPAPADNNDPKVDPKPSPNNKNTGNSNGGTKNGNPFTKSDGGKKSPSPSDFKNQKFFPIEKYPRRAMVISINDYLFANPLTYGDSLEGDNKKITFPGSSAYAVLKAFGNYYMKFPNTQLFEVSDSSNAVTNKSEIPIKPVVKNAVEQFLNTSRPQDRIVLMFSGHAVVDAEEKDVHLVPIDGDLEDPKTLLPLSWLYKQLETCPCRQKVLILDVCRHNRAKGYIRLGGEPMTEFMDKRFKEVPAGVQLWVSCQPEQQSLEFEKGSLFQEALCAAMWERLDNIQQPDESLPLDQLLPRVNKYLSSRLSGEVKQVSKIYGSEPKTGAAFNPDESPALTFDVNMPPLKGGAAGKAVVKSILDEINAAPPPRKAGKLPFWPRFSAKVLAEYQIDGYASEQEFLNRDKEFPLRAAIVKAKKAMSDFTDLKVKEFFGGNTSAKVKETVKKEQQEPGKAIFFLKEALEELEAAEKYVETEPSKRWQAHYYFTVARLKTHLIYVLEYNTLLAQIRTDSLIELPKGAVGYRVGSTERPNCKEPEVRTWRKDLKRLWPKIIDEYPDTPWALLARREKDAALGLEWKAAMK